jgi:hypothetical protein
MYKIKLQIYLPELSGLRSLLTVSFNNHLKMNKSLFSSWVVLYKVVSYH